MSDQNNNSDPVNHPAHYTSHASGVECITIAEWFSFNIGNAIKYIWRAGRKGDRVEDLKKARFYLDREIGRLTGGKDQETAFEKKPDVELESIKNQLEKKWLERVSLSRSIKRWRARQTPRGLACSPPCSCNFCDLDRVEQAAIKLDRLQKSWLGPMPMYSEKLPPEIQERIREQLQKSGLGAVPMYSRELPEELKELIDADAKQCDGELMAGQGCGHCEKCTADILWYRELRKLAEAATEDGIYLKDRDERVGALRAFINKRFMSEAAKQRTKLW